jgi:hypothetical protein
MKRLIILAAVTPLVIGGVALAKEDKKDHKVTICHATSAEKNPWVRIVVDQHATTGHFDNNGTPLAGHEDDVLLEGDVSCPVVTTPEVPVTPTTPVSPVPPVEEPEPTETFRGK